MAKSEKGRHEKEGISTMKKSLLLVFATVLAFIVTCFYFFWNNRMVPDSFIYGFFGLVTGECGCLGWIKNSQERKENRRWQIQDRQHDEERMDKQNAVQFGGGDPQI